MEYLENTIDSDEPFNVKTVFSKYVLDSVASCVFGMDIQSIKVKISKMT